MSTTQPLTEGKRYTQVSATTGSAIRIVEIVQVGEVASVVRACHGPIAGTQYEVPNAALVAR